ncbi:MAG: HDIG domain-containing protein [candidate division Zixibacteria bacterium]|nr:HDIG domain-containing protein [candidate division Zixibacteria bacterium]
MRDFKKSILSKPNSEKNGRGHKVWPHVFRAVLALVTTSIIVFLFPLSSIYQSLDLPAVGSIAEEEIVAPFTFPVLKSKEELEEDKKLVLANLPVILDFDQKKGDSVITSVKRFFARVDSVNKSNQIPESRRRDFRLIFPYLEEEGIILLSSGKDLGIFGSNLIAILKELYQVGMVQDIQTLPFSENGKAIIPNGNKETPDSTQLSRAITKDELLDLSRAKERLLSLAMVKFENDQFLVKALYEIGSRFLVPNLSLDQKEIERRKQERLSSITKQKGLILKEETIVAKGQRVTKADFEKLSSMAKFRVESGLKSNPWHFLFPLLGRIFFVGAILLGLALFLYSIKREIFYDNTKLLMISSIIVFEMVIAYLILFQWHLSEYLIPVTIASMLLTILLDLEVGLISTFALGLLLGIVNLFDFKLAFISIVAGTLACYSVKEVTHRYRFYRPMLFISFAYVVFIYFAESLKLSSPGAVLSLCGYGLFNGFISPILTIGLLPIFESIFDVSTDITLLELSDLNRPLLKRLALEAPGTYHHSIIVANLAEAAAKTIGANVLLARVGAYYHDIGKIEKPEYFVENQTGAKNKHEKLVPSMSALILESHVKEGVEMAVEANLPKRIIDFIQEHHGTTLMSYFYNKALEQGATQELMDEYRYPGPKPRSKETAIVMLADAVEAASRTLDDPKPSRIKSLIKKIIDSKLQAGELADSNLTFRELSAIQQSFLPVLISVFHPRVEYPEPVEKTV